MVQGVVTAVAAAGVALTGLVVASEVRDREPGTAPASAVVSRVIDGATVLISSGDRVRLIGLETPGRGDCGFALAASSLRGLVEGRRVSLVKPVGVPDRDAADRLLRFVRVAGRDVGLAQIRAGRVEAGNDSRDGHDWHPREGSYRRAARGAAPHCGRD